MLQPHRTIPFMPEYTIEQLTRQTMRALGYNLSGCHILEPIPLSVEEEIRQRTEYEGNMIRVALGYIRAGDSKAAARILEAIGK